jgi:hypothetical protein
MEPNARFSDASTASTSEQAAAARMASSNVAAEFKMKLPAGLAKERPRVPADEEAWYQFNVWLADIPKPQPSFVDGCAVLM